MSKPIIRPREHVILAEDFDRVVAWYRDILGFQIRRLFDEGIHYANLETDTGIELGIALASEVDVEPGDRSRNTVVLQFETDDVGGLLDHVAANAGTVVFGPAFNESDGFSYGAFADVEGNQCWLVSAACPK